VLTAHSELNKSTNQSIDKSGYNLSMHFITDSLMVGNQDDALAPPLFVNAVLFLAAECPITPPGGVAFECIPLVEFEEADPLVMQRAVDWLERHEGERVMVCCRAGMGRSVSIVMAYLCCVKDMSYADALKLMKARRPGATPLPRLKHGIARLKQLRRPCTLQSDHPQDAT
jgi:protein-tyrosine phosphatase